MQRSEKGLSGPRIETALSNTLQWGRDSLVLRFKICLPRSVRDRVGLTVLKVAVAFILYLELQRLCK